MRSSSNRRLEAVLFDFDHTLGIDHRLEEGVLRDLSRRWCTSPLTDDAIAAVLRRFRTGEVGLEAMLSGAFAACAPPPDVLGAYKAEALSRVSELVTAFPHCAQTLVALRDRGLRTAVLSNGWTELQRAKAAAVGFAGPVYVSEEIGAWKPDAAAFRYAAERLEVDSSRCAYVGDSPLADVEGARNAGMTAIWADLESQTYPGGCAAPDFIIHDLQQLLSLPGLEGG